MSTVPSTPEEANSQSWEHHDPPSTEAAPTDASDESPTRKSQADKLVEIVLSDPAVELFHTSESDVYATVQVGTHRETWPLNGKGFRNWLGGRYYRQFAKAAGSQATQDALNTLAGRALFEGKERRVVLRLAEHEGAVWLDLCDAEWNAVRVTPAGWAIVPSAEVPVRFIRRRGMQSLPLPVHGGSIDELRSILNLEDPEKWTLYWGWIMGAFNPNGPYGVMGINGEQGSGKSTACKLGRRMIDPNLADLRRPPRDERDVFIAAGNGWISSYNNLSGLRPEISDALCALATDGGFATRKLYENDDETIFDARRPVIVNGIDELADRPDFVDRMVTIFLPPIPENKRMEERKVLAAFAAMHARVLGAFLDGVSSALRNLPTLELPEKPRMADLAAWVTAAEEGLGKPQGTFLKAYIGNRSDANLITIESVPTGPYLLMLLAEAPWEGTATDLLAKLNQLRGEAQVPHEWPKNGRAMGSALRRLAPNLRAMGFKVYQPTKGSGHDKARIIQLDKGSQERSARPASSATPSETAAVGGSADRADHADRPPPPLSNELDTRAPGLCRACGRSSWWERGESGLTCGHCHPPPDPTAVTWHHGEGDR